MEISTLPSKLSDPQYCTPEEKPTERPASGSTQRPSVRSSQLLRYISTQTKQHRDYEFTTMIST